GQGKGAIDVAVHVADLKLGLDDGGVERHGSPWGIGNRGHCNGIGLAGSEADAWGCVRTPRSWSRPALPVPASGHRFSVVPWVQLGGSLAGKLSSLSGWTSSSLSRLPSPSRSCFSTRSSVGWVAGVGGPSLGLLFMAGSFSSKATLPRAYVASM